MSNSTPHTRWSAAVILGAAASLILAVVVLAFMWPSKTSTPHNLPVSVTGPQAATTALEQALAAQGVFTFVEADDREQAQAQVESRQTYGAFVLGAQGTAPEVFTATAGSAVAAQILNGTATGIQSQLAQQVAHAGGDPASVTVKVTDLAPLSADDPTGAGLAASAFPLAIGGMLGGVIISLGVVGPLRRLAALGGFAVAAGLVLNLIMQSWFHYVHGEFWMNFLAMGLTMLATSSFIVGCTSLVGKAGIGIGAVATMLIGNPLAGTIAPWQFIPEPWGAIGQYMVPGASGWLIRSLSYFPEDAATQQWLTLTIWAGVGIILTLIGHFRSRSEMRINAKMIEPAT